MSFLPPLFQRLAAIPAVPATFQVPGQFLRIFPTVAPQGTAYPYARYQLVNGAPEIALSGPPEMDADTYQFSVWGKDYAQAKAAAEVIRDALETMADVTAFRQLDDDPDTGSSGFVLDVDLWESRL